MILVISRWRAVGLALAVLGLAAGGLAQAQKAGGTAGPITRSEVRALAHLEPESGAIVIGARPGMRVEQVLVAEGQDVKAGELLTVLEGHDQRERQLALAEAQRDAARFQRRLRREQLTLERARFDRLKQPRLDSLRATIADLKGKVGQENGAQPGHTVSDREGAVKLSVPATAVGTPPQPAAAAATSPRPATPVGTPPQPAAAAATSPRPATPVGTLPQPAAAAATSPRPAAPVGTQPQPAAAAATSPRPAAPVGTLPQPAAAAATLPQDVHVLSAQLRTELARTEIQLKEFEASLELLERQRKLEDEPNGEDSPETVVLDRQVELARADVAGAEVRAPASGRILAVSVRAGEVSPGPLLTLGDVRTMVARAEVFQTDVLNVAVGDTAEVFILGRTVAGKVTRVGTTVAKNTISSLDPAELADRRVVDVVVRLADPALAARLVNMQVDVAIRKKSTAATGQ
jgi:multidrug resistance efflux pump